MKKAFIITLALMFVVTGMAIAGIRGSKHDLSSSGNQNTRSTNIDRLCVFCHTPHAGDTTAPAPLWNRSAGSTTWTNTSAYSSSTLDGSSYGMSSYPTSISGACLTCHDGNVGDETLLNGPGSGTTSSVTWQNDVFSTVANLNDGSGLQNDHPIGVNMEAVNAVDDEIYNTPQDTTLQLFNGLIECATCHAVHNSNVNGDCCFLTGSTSGSHLCLACHIK